MGLGLRLSTDQQVVLDEMLGFAHRAGPGDLLTVGGFAGTGKSTVLAEFASSVEALCAFVTPTGRAAGVLRKKLAARGVDTRDGARTRLEGDPNATEHFCDNVYQLMRTPQVNAQQELLGFRDRDLLDRSYGLIVIDEASMVGDDLLATIKRFGVPILAVGDHFQLPPVQDTGSLMKDPDHRLEKIHRQAAGNPIIAVSAAIRETGAIPKKLIDGKHVRVLGRSALQEVIRSVSTTTDVEPLDTAIICWRNATRVALNAMVRDELGLTTNPVFPKKGDIVMALRNIHRLGIMNGMRGLVLEDAEQDDHREWIITAPLAFFDENVTVSARALLSFGGMCWPSFERDKPFQTVDDFKRAASEQAANVKQMSQIGWPFDFGYAMTCHKAQGSQFKRVAVVVDRRADPDDLEYRRWFYTAATRAVNELIIVQT